MRLGFMCGDLMPPGVMSPGVRHRFLRYHERLYVLTGPAEQQKGGRTRRRDGYKCGGGIKGRDEKSRGIDTRIAVAFTRVSP